MYVATVSASNEDVIDNFQNDLHWVERPSSTEVVLRLDDDEARDYLFEYVQEETYLIGTDATADALESVELERLDMDAFEDVEVRVESGAFESLEVRSVKNHGEREYALLVERAEGTERVDITYPQYMLVESLVD